ncbi:MAG: transposase [Acidimicrobiales bacterium]
MVRQSTSRAWPFLVHYSIAFRAGLDMAEGLFSQLKRSLDGTHHHVSVQHLPRYLAEFDFRYTTRKGQRLAPHGEGHGPSRRS